MNTSELTGVLRDLMLTPAPSGYESAMAFKMREYFLKYTDDVVIDRVGNCIATFPGTRPDAHHVMAFAHMDSLGFIIRRIDDDGYIRVDRLGGIPEKVLPASPVKICREDGAGWIDGTFGVKAHHTTSPEEKFRVNTLPELYIDIGAKSAEEVRAAGIEVGCPVVYRPAFQQLLGTHVAGTSIDNRSGCTALIKMASLLAGQAHECTVHLVGTVWEEFNLRGAMMANRTVKCDIGICVDGSSAADTPDMRSASNLTLGGGPVVKKYSFHGRGTLNGLIVNRPLLEHALATAERHGLPCQRAAGIGGLTDAAYLQLENDGVACIEIGSPCRYAHSPNESADVFSIEKTGELVGAMLLELRADFDPKRF
ncbi:M42 family metallopeptidase [Feifania hominis]|uniref:M20/M25/M40 family metallo-hydrolase n=1 Tax=Feifania hominis TaxID=2763660 RepID=A0A926DEY3_9FIRM|nr:M20/M25/M40 family metallo-hydrolase [Feifania hominis]MBC8535785.1 M20/M25/M40 family metallo-hydrolase [Feifania hominis]